MRKSRSLLFIRRRVVPVVVFALLPLAFAGTAHAATPSSLDTTCAGTGTHQDDLGGDDFSNTMLLEPDGKILSIGNSDAFASQDIVLIRYTAGCQRDTSFGNNGEIVIDASGAEVTDDAKGVLLQPDGKIVIAGSRSNGTDNDLVVVRLTSAGGLDTSWDGDGLAVVNAGGNEQSTGVAVQADSKIIVSGASDKNGTVDSLIARFNANGTPDQTFNGSGVRVYSNSGTQTDAFTGIAVQSDGLLVVSGYVNNGSQDHGIAERVKADGFPDTTFATSGVFTQAGNDCRFNAVTIRPDGRILLAGYVSNGTDDDFYVQQLTTGGSSNGFNTATIGSGDDRANALALQPDGGVVLAGSSSASSGSIVRFSALLGNDYQASDGAPCGADTLTSVAVAPDGTIVAAGYCNALGAPDFLLARWDGAPSVRMLTIGQTVNENVGSALVQVVRTSTLTDLTIDYATSNGSAVAGSDYTAASGTVAFPAGASTESVSIPITNDSTAEGAESFTVTLSNPGPASYSAMLVAPLSTTVTINPSDQQSDGQVKANGGSYIGNNIYNLTGTGQAVTQSASRLQKKVFYVAVQNDGNQVNDYAVKGTPGAGPYKVSYWLSTSTQQITYAVVTFQGYPTRLEPGASLIIRVEITAASTAPHGSTKTVAVTSTWAGDGVHSDVVKAMLHTI